VSHLVEARHCASIFSPKYNTKKFGNISSSQVNVFPFEPIRHSFYAILPTENTANQKTGWKAFAHSRMLHPTFLS